MQMAERERKKRRRPSELSEQISRNHRVRASGSSREQPLVSSISLHLAVRIEENALAAELARIRTGQIPGELSSFRTCGKKEREMKCRARNMACHSCVAVRSSAKRAAGDLLRGHFYCENRGVLEHVADDAK